MIVRGLFLILICWCAQASAHQQKEAITNIVFNERTKYLEITHRFYVHDAEHVMKAIDPKHYDLLASKQAQRLFAEYATKQFSLQFKNNNSEPLTLLGQEFDGKFLWVYQETPIPELYFKHQPVTLSVKQAALTELIPKQRNLVYVDYGEQLKTFAFTKKSEPETLTIQAN